MTATNEKLDRIAFPDEQVNSVVVLRKNMNEKKLVELTTDAIVRANERVFRQSSKGWWGKLEPGLLFNRNDTLVWRPARWEDGDFRAVDEAFLEDYMDDAIKWVDPKGHAIESPWNLPIKKIAAKLKRRIPRIDSVTRRPVFGTDGDFLYNFGYHEKEKLWHEADKRAIINPLHFPKIPTQTELINAILVLERELEGIPFRSDADKARFVLAMTEPFVRRMIGGHVPLYELFSRDSETASAVCRWYAEVCNAGYGLIEVSDTDRRDEIVEKIACDQGFGNRVCTIDCRGSESGEQEALEAIGVVVESETDERMTWLITRGGHPEDEYVKHWMSIWLDEPGPLMEVWKAWHAADANRGCRAVVVALLTVIRAGFACCGPFGRVTDQSWLEGWSLVMRRIHEVFRIPRCYDGERPVPTTGRLYPNDDRTWGSPTTSCLTRP